MIMELNEIDRDEQQERLKAVYEMGRANGYLIAKLEELSAKTRKLMEVISHV